jgi:isocitrate lyase
MFELSRRYRETGMSAYSNMQEKEFASEREHGYQAVKHQRFVGTGYFDQVQQVISAGLSSTTALAGSTESEQFSPDEGHTEPRLKVEAATAIQSSSMRSDIPREDMLQPSGD